MKMLSKKVSAIIIVLAMIVAMLPLIAIPVHAARSGVIYLNGETTDKTVDSTWLEANCIDPQIFPFPSQKGKTWKYVVAKGPSYEAFLKEAYGITDLEEIANAKVDFKANTNGYSLPVKNILNSKECFKLIDETGADVTGAFNNDDGHDAVASSSGYPDVTPIIAVKEHEYDSYVEAKTALDEKTWETGATTDIRPYIGGDLSEEVYLKKAGKVDQNAYNFLGKYSISNDDINLKLPKRLNIGDITFTTANSKKVKLPFKLTDKEISMMYGDVTWRTTDENVALVDDGMITPNGIGECQIVATFSKASNVEAVCDVTVDRKVFAPGNVKLSATSKKGKKSITLSWKKASNAESYVVKYCLKGQKKYTSKTTTKLSFKINKLKKGKTYVVRVCAVRTFNGQKLYGNWTAKNVKVK